MFVPFTCLMVLLHSVQMADGCFSLLFSSNAKEYQRNMFLLEGEDEVGVLLGDLPMLIC